MPESTTRNVDSALPRFPWVEVGSVAIAGMFLGIFLALAFAWPSLGRGDVLMGIGLGFSGLVVTWRSLEAAVTKWREAFRAQVVLASRRELATGQESLSAASFDAPPG